MQPIVTVIDKQTGLIVDQPLGRNRDTLDPERYPVCMADQLRNEILVDDKGEKVFIRSIANTWRQTLVGHEIITNIKRNIKSTKNRYWVYEGSILRAAQSTRSVALEFLTPNRVLINLEGLH